MCTPYYCYTYVFIHKAIEFIQCTNHLLSLFKKLLWHSISMSRKTAFLTLCLHLVNLLQGQVSHATTLHFSWSSLLAANKPIAEKADSLSTNQFGCLLLPGDYISPPFISVKTNQSQFWSHADFDSMLLREPISSSYSDALQ